MKHRLLLLNIFAAILVSLTWASAQTKYTANFATQPTIDKYGFANDWPWNSTVTVNLGGVDYLITDAINGSWGWNGSAVTHSTAGDVYYKIVRKDGKTFNFFGVKLQYTNVTNAPEFYKYPFLTVDYASVGTTVADELYDSNRTVTVSKPNGVPVSNVILRFSGVLELVLDDLIVGPIAGQLVAPTVTTNAASSISTNSAVLGGSVTADGGGAVTSRGVVYSNTNNTPTIGGNSVTQSANGTGTGTFAQTISGLTPNTNYYTRAYAVNSSGTGYGAVQTFTTTQLTTAAPLVLVPANGSMVTTTTPTYGGNAPATSTVALYVDGTSIGTVTANGAGNWARTQPTTLAQGSHTVYATAQLNGQTVSANSSTNTFTVDSVRPSLSITSTASEPTNVSPIPVTITFLEAVTGFVAGDLTVSNGTLSGFSGSGSSYSVNVTPTTSGVVTLNVPANVAQDAAGNGNTASTPFSRQYQFPNSAPTDIQLSQTTVAENQPSGTTVGTLTSTDADTPAQTFTYALVSGNGDTDNAAFSVEGTTLKTARSFDFETKASYSIRVRTTDSGSPAASFEKTFTLSLTDQNELVATFTSQTNVSCFDQANGSLTVSATGEAGPYTYHWSAGSSTSATLSGLTAGPYSVTVTAAKGFTAVATTTLTQPAAVLAPVLEASAFTTTNQPITVTANGCPGGALNWALSGGTGQATSTTFTLTQPGNYTLTASCTLNGCTGPYSAPVALQIRPGGFAITGVSAANCQLLDAGRGLYDIRLTPQYGDASGPISFSIVNELSPTTAPGPYTLRLYSDNPMITLVATQSGSPEARFVYNWLAACSAGTSPNRPPVARSIPDQSLPQGQAYSLELADYITDPDGQPLTFSATGLPADLTLSGSRISGTAATTGVSGITIKALDPAGLEVTTNFQLTITPLISTPAGFTIVGVTTVNCQTLSTGQRQVQFLPQYGGVTGQPVTFQVTNELAPTQQTGPYTLRLYTDNPIISLQATQAGSATTATYRYNWLAGCGIAPTTPPPANRAPVVGSGVASQTATVGQGYTLVIPAGTFADPDGDALSLSATGLPAGLSFVGSTLTGTPSTTGVSTVTLTAADPAGLSTSLSFALTVAPATGNPPSTDFAITQVGTLQCEVISAGQRRVSFTPQYSGVSSSPISFSVVNELSPTTAPGPYSLALYTDNPTITLQAQQGSSVASYSYNWLAACNARSRQSAAELSSPLQVTVLGNPVVGQQVRVEVRGAEGQSLRLSLTDQQGRSMNDQTVERANALEQHTFTLSPASGNVLLLRVSTSTQSQTVKLIKVD